MMDYIKYLWYSVYLPIRCSRFWRYIKSPGTYVAHSTHVYRKRDTHIVWNNKHGILFKYNSKMGFHNINQSVVEENHQSWVISRACEKVRHLFHSEITFAADKFEINFREHHPEIHNWLTRGSTKYRIQCFQQFSYFMISEWQIHAALTNKIQFPAQNPGTNVFVYKTKECVNRDFSSRIDAGESPLTVLSDALSLPVWIIKQMRNDESLAKMFFCKPTQQFFKTVYFLGQYGHPNMVKNLGASDFEGEIHGFSFLLGQNNIISRSILNKIQNDGGLMSVAGDIPLSKFGVVKFWEIVETDRFLGKYTDKFDFDLDDATSRFSHLFPNIRTLIRLSDDWHENVAPHLQTEKKYVWEYKMSPVSAEVNGEIYVCTPVTNTIALCNEGLRQHHCVASRNEKCASGESIIFSVRGPHNSTIEFNNQGDVIEHKMKRNGKPNNCLLEVEKHLRKELLKDLSLIAVKNVKLVGDGQSVEDVNARFWNEKFPEIASYLSQHPKKQ